MDPFNCKEISKFAIFVLLTFYLGPLFKVAAKVAFKEPSPYWQEHWDDHEQNLTLIYSDPFITFYSDFEVNFANSRSDIFIPLSFAWKFVNSVYNTSESFVPDPRLYVILHSDKHIGSRFHLYTNASADHRNVIECGKPKKEGFCTLVDVLDSVDVIVTKFSESQVKTGAPNIISEWRILFIVVYDKIVQDGLVGAANTLKTHFQHKTVSFPQGPIYLNSEWYLFIYENYGGSKAIKSFLSVYDQYTKSWRSSTNSNSSNSALTPGEFVFLWSQAVGSDLRDLAYRTFGWFRDYRTQFEETREKLSFTTFPESYPNSSWYLPPSGFQNKHQNLTLFDGHVAFYFENSEDKLKPDIEKFTAFVSKVWRFAKESYGPFPPDPVLQINLFFRRQFYIKCSIANIDWQKHKVYVPGLHSTCILDKTVNFNNSPYDEYIVSQIASLAMFLMKETITWPGERVSRSDIIRDMLIYDMNIGLGRTEDAEKWRNVSISRTEFDTARFLFRDWYYPIYTKYGEKNIFHQFSNLLYLHWPRKGTDFVGQMNSGEWVHFWSAAVGEDLSYLAIRKRGWTLENDDELIQARSQYSQLNDNYVVNTSPPLVWEEHWEHHKEELYLAHSDENVAFYFDSGLDRNITWPFQLMSRAWKFANDKYGPLGRYPLLYIVLHHKPSSCTSSKTNSFWADSYENKNVIDCGRSNDYWNSEISSAGDLLLAHLTRVILANGKNTGFKALDWAMETILVYDMYLNLGLEEDARRWKQQMLSYYTDEASSSNTFWFRDWYYPIYNNFGGTKAIDDFFSILYSSIKERNNDYDNFKNFNLEIMIHFWSAAVGQNLWRVATKAFGWNIGNHLKFLQVRGEYPLHYTDMYLNTTIAVPSEKMHEFWNDHREEITLVYVDASIAIYYDSEMDISMKYPFESLSQAWKYAQKTYGPIGSDNILYVVLHADKDRKECDITKVTNHSNSFQDVHVLECARRYGEWKYIDAEELLQDLIIEMGYIVILNPLETWKFHKSSFYEMANTLAYDIYMEIDLTNLALIILERDYYTYFRGWYLPIYAKHGGSKALKSFLKLMHSIEPQSRLKVLDKDDYLNDGRLVHFWSGAAGVNLSYLAKNVFKSIYLKERFQEAVEEYSWIKYNDSDPTAVVLYDSTPLLLQEQNFDHKELLINAYVDSSVVIYFDIKVHKSIKWPFNLLSRAWKQTLTGYETLKFAPNSKLNVFLHSNGPTGCHSSNHEGEEKSKEPKEQGDDDETKKANDKKIIIDCGIESANTVGRSEASFENTDTDALIFEVANITQQSANQFVGKEAYERTPFTEILVFDLYLKLGRLEDAFRFLQTRTEITVGAGRFWKRDWYLPIYTQYGGTSVFSRFLSLLAKHWNQSKLKQNNKNQRKMNIGEFVHFWSAAVGTNLYENAEYTFGWNEHHKDLKQFNDARKSYSFNYSCYDCHKRDLQNETNPLVLGLSIGVGISALAAFLLLIFGYRKYKILKNQIRELTEDEVKEFHEGTSDANNSSNIDGNASIASRPFDIAFEIPREFLQVDRDEVLGSGEFGIVLRGIIKSHGEKFTVDTTVAVKTVKPNVDVTYFKSLLTELKVMAFLGSHPNIASLLGACTVNIRNREVFVAIEFCSKGDLLGFLKRNRPHFSDLMIRQNNTNATSVETSFSKNGAEPNNTDSDASNAFSTLNLLDWSIQISNGMAFIASKNVIHGDLAARNVLITADNIVKISDFGLSRQLANYSIYMKTSRTPVPWRWMAIESLLEMNFSIRSDVWSFGVTLFEIFSLGTTPYPGWTWDHKFVEKLVQGERLTAPEFGNDEIYCLMMDCMKKEPMERILFPEMISKLEIIKSNLVSTKKDGVPNSNYLNLTLSPYENI